MNQSPGGAGGRELQPSRTIGASPPTPPAHFRALPLQPPAQHPPRAGDLPGGPAGLLRPSLSPVRTRPVLSHRTQTLATAAAAAAKAGRDGRIMDGMTTAPSDSNLPTFFRWCLGGMAAFASGSGSASARDADADAAERVLRLGREVELECGDISASQEDILARAPFLGGGGGGGEEEAEVFSTPPHTQGQHSQQGQEVEEEEDVITMCSVPFTQPSPSALSSSEDEDQVLVGSKPRKPRVCTRKVRGARIRTPTPSPSHSPDNRGSSTSSVVDPLYRAVLMIPTTPAPPTATEDLLALARNRGIF